LSNLQFRQQYTLVIRMQGYFRLALFHELVDVDSS
jgi:hypothetical protein